MKPIALSGHTRSLTMIRYNLEGDVLFTAAKDASPSAWWTHNGERIGSYEGHNGTVWCLDVRFDSTLLLTGSADNSCNLWDVQTGEVICSIETKSAVRACAFSYSGNQLFYSTDKAMGQLSELRVYTLADVNKPDGGNAIPYLTIPSTDSKITAAVWGAVDESIITGHDNGAICKWDAKTGALIKRVKEHSKKISDIQMKRDQTLFITACQDQHSKIFDADDLSVIKSFKTERPVNSAAMCEVKDHCVLGGGQDAMSVTTTKAKVGKFDAAFYHTIYEEELGRVKGHFGPINTIQFHPNGKQYCSGGEDGYVRMHNFDASYFEFEYDVAA
eukprot:m.90685 g.90685  ORF g.90685 m.90685 type:complete len:330 (+) comp26418_c0_seq2:146-1135(+)